MATETITLRMVLQDLASGNMSKAIGKMDQMARRGGIVGGVFQGIGIQMGMMLNPLNLAIRGFGMVTDAVSDAVNTAADFDQAMTQSLAIMGDVSEALRDEMAEAAREVGRTTTFAAKQAAEAYFFLASAGLDAEQSIRAMPKVAAFAQAGMFDLAQATDLLTDAQSALGLTIRDDVTKNMTNMTRVSDVLVKANTLANATVEQFSKALTSKAGAALKAFGISIEEGVAVLAAFADQGVKAEEAGNALDRILRLMTDAALKNEDAYRRLGIEVFDASGELRNLGDIVGEMEVAFAGMSDKQLQATLGMLGFKARVQGVIKPLLGTSEAIHAYEEALGRAGGTTETVAQKQLKSFRSQVELLNSRIADLSLQFGQDLIPHFERAIELIEQAADIAGVVTNPFEDLFGFSASEGDKAAASLRSMQRILAATTDEMDRAIETNRHLLITNIDESGARLTQRDRVLLFLAAVNNTIEAERDLAESERAATEEAEQQRLALDKLRTAMRDVAEHGWRALKDEAREAQQAIREAFRTQRRPLAAIASEEKTLLAQRRKAAAQNRADIVSLIDLRLEELGELRKHYRQVLRNIRQEREATEADRKARRQRINNLKAIQAETGRTKDEAIELWRAFGREWRMHVDDSEVDELLRKLRLIAEQNAHLATVNVRNVRTQRAGPRPKKKDPDRQHGGPVYPFESYTVGERGPETLVMGSRAGHIIPHGGAFPFIYAPQYSTASPEEARRFATEIMPSLMREMGRIR